MKILIVAATEPELSQIRKYAFENHEVKFLVTGAGMIATTFALTDELSKNEYDLAINIGIAGSFNRSIKIGETVCIRKDCFSEKGAEDDHAFLTMDDLGLVAETVFHPTAEVGNINLRKVTSITVNTVHGNADSIRKIVSRLSPDIETMEGAAFFFVCQKKNIPAFQLRSISNYIEKRNKDAWNIPLALVSLSEKVFEILKYGQLDLSAFRHQSGQINLKMAFSPCPNDTFMFDAIVHKRINLHGFHFEVSLEDIETLNQKTLAGIPDISKISYAILDEIHEKYELLTSGSALGSGVGPLFVSKKIFNYPDKEIRTVGIPGKNTTAYRLLRRYFPALTNVHEIIFSQIEDAILHGDVDAGVIIHENRFTYQSKGLLKIADLGELWEKETDLPIPLGGIVIRKTLPTHVKEQINRLVHDSVRFAIENPAKSSDYVRKNAQEMNEEVMRQHINLYVNNYSVDLGVNGRKAILHFLGDGSDRHSDICFVKQPASLSSTL